MIRRLSSASLAALLVLAPSTAVLADGPAAGTHLYQTPARMAPRPMTAPIMAAPADQVLRVDLTSSGAQSLALSRGKSAIIELPVDVRDMLVTNPAVADAVLRGPRRIYVMGMALGSTDAVFFDASGRKILSLAIRVEQDSTALEDTLRRVLPNASIQVQAIRDSVILTGSVANTGEAGMASQIASKFVEKPDDVLNMLTIAGKDQVMLKVRIVEVQRNVIKQLGVSTDLLFNDGFKSYSLGRSNTFGVNGALVGGGGACYGRDNIRTTNVANTATSNGSSSSSSTNNTNSTSTSADWTGSLGQVSRTVYDINGRPVTVLADQTGVLHQVNGSTTGSTTGLSSVLSSVASTAFKTVTGNKLSGCLQAFERVGLLHTLAEPNLTVVSGEAGKFLVGGEFPVPVAQDSSGRISLEFKPYGVGLGYTPVVMSGGRISLKLSTEVSELTSLGAFTLGGSTSGGNLSVPGLTVRRAETTVELPSGGSLMIAGLLQQTTKQNVDSLPGMTNLPILGSLFRSRDYLNGETELVVIITPYIVDPTRPQDLQTPADGLQTASDMSTVLLGRLNKVVKAPIGANSGRAYQGPVGYVIE
ncbi:type II and III secretion system protein family protein [Caulobacter sp. BE254]|uniref:type II and III secretion system protein family protein n=1 Tax=Caulobacter sp. BE254 TaxID=2817720 RepID=UPI00285F5B72|nr:type II and III secretion system protein family protein [Caulobacter sp. BE254]MDR7118574.1 pilus assembly protein CpaC [Caulobacter sp. BE254]